MVLHFAKILLGTVIATNTNVPIATILPPIGSTLGIRINANADKHKNTTTPE